jgi:hypothetical protein
LVFPGSGLILGLIVKKKQEANWFSFFLPGSIGAKIAGLLEFDTAGGYHYLNMTHIANNLYF